ncbi:hypothetical protein MCAP1_003567 [Malassezia caprae]|uniref:Acyl-CoA thioesterase II n=1 Tax=Malassezia caprae TaxID=1381934 RepID=A0AAF0IX29_9BASI|nr:hypothetical protein MCAP1_003567 [Malassezia caprae]
MEAGGLLRLVGVKPTGDPWVWEGVSLPLGMGNLRPIAYGGFAIATAVVAAGATLPQEVHLVPYSLVGHFLGPASLESPFVCEVTSIRDTRNFATRFVLVKQRGPDGQLRSVLSVTLDMIASPQSTPEKLQQHRANNTDPASVASVVRYESRTPWQVELPDQLPPVDQYLAQRLAAGELPESVVSVQQTFLGLWHELFDMRAVPSSMMDQNMIGLVDVQTSQDQLPLQDRRSFDWMHLKSSLPPIDGSKGPAVCDPLGMHPISPIVAHLATLAFAMDGAIAFAPLSFAKQSLFDAQVASTLEFALRFHTDTLDVNQWLLREIIPVHGGWQRHYGEARVFDHAGHHIATCTQQCVMRPSDPDAVASMQAPKPYAPVPKL